MPTLNTTIVSSFEHYFEDFRSRVVKLSMGIPDSAFWIRPYLYGNSMGNLVLHLNGNLAYYIGSVLGGTGYRRNRELEFSRTQDRSRESVMQEFNATIDTVQNVLRDQTVSDWGADYVAVGVDDVHDRFSIFLRCAVHFHHHIGQMIYLSKAINGETND